METLVTENKEEIAAAQKGVVDTKYAIDTAISSRNNSKEYMQGIIHASFYHGLYAEDLDQLTKYYLEKIK